jgi:hypothetical protein
VILLVAIVVSVLVALVCGGRLSGLAGLRVRYAWLVLVAVAGQALVVFNVVGQAPVLGLPLGRVLDAATTLVVLAVLWTNRRLPGLWLVGLGLVANLAAIVANGGLMPVAPEAIRAAGWRSPAPGTKPYGSENIILPRAATRLWWLTDIIAARFPVPSVFSPGDVLVALGLFWLIFDAMMRGRGAPAGQRAEETSSGG